MTEEKDIERVVLTNERADGPGLHEVDRIAFTRPWPVLVREDQASYGLMAAEPVAEIRFLAGSDDAFAKLGLRRIDDLWWEVVYLEARGEAARKVAGAVKKAADLYAEHIDEDLAREILRMHESMSWRSVAQALHGTREWATWEPPYNQLVGIALCQRAYERRSP